MNRGGGGWKPCMFASLQVCKVAISARGLSDWVIEWQPYKLHYCTYLSHILCPQLGIMVKNFTQHATNSHTTLHDSKLCHISNQRSGYLESNSRSIFQFGIYKMKYCSDFISWKRSYVCVCQLNGWAWASPTLEHSMSSFVCTVHMYVGLYIAAGSTGSVCHWYCMPLLPPHAPIVPPHSTCNSKSETTLSLFTRLARLWTSLLWRPHKQKG